MDSYRLMTYNIRHGEGLDGRLDLGRVTTAIQQSGADLVAIREVDRHTDRVASRDELVELIDSTELGGAFSRSIDYCGGSYGNAILYRFPRLDEHRCALPGREPRSALACDFALPRGGALRFVSAHLDLNEPSRLESVRVLLAFLAQLPPMPTILAGDLNALPDSPTLLAFARDGWRLAVGDPLSPTYPADQPQIRIDYLLARDLPPGMALTQARVGGDCVASDHRPVVAVLTVQREAMS